ncbi:MAG: PLDc N-terminal domain-containing protein [Chitinophagaceae bacterium]
MKHSRALWLIATGTLIFAIGLFLPLTMKVFRTGVLIAGAALVFLFYLSILFEVLTSKNISPSRRVFWLVAIICVPILGNLIYIVMNDSMKRRQTPRFQNY